GDGIEEAADHQEDEGDEEADAGDAQSPGRDVGKQRFGYLVVGEQPAEGRGGADAKERYRGKPPGLGERLVQMPQVHLAVDEDRQSGGVKNGDRRRFGGGEPAEQDAADDDERREERRDRLPPRAQKS